jgi:hypothetical protein
MLHQIFQLFLKLLYPCNSFEILKICLPCGLAQSNQ